MKRKRETLADLPEDERNKIIYAIAPQIAKVINSLLPSKQQKKPEVEQ